MTPESLTASFVSISIGPASTWNASRAAVFERVRRVSGLCEVAVLEGIRVDDEKAALDKVVEVGFERGGVHRNEAVGVVSGCEDVPICDMDLEGGDTVDGPRGCADLGREVGERGEVVAEERRARCELRADELHPVAGVTCEPDDDIIDLFWRWSVVCQGLIGHWFCS